MPRATSYRYWCFTSFFVDGAPLWDPSVMRYMIYQLEECPTSKAPHWQGVVGFFANQRQGKVQDYLGLNPCHVEPSRSAAINEYVSKLRTRLEGPFIHGLEPKAGQRTDWIALKEKIKTGLSIREIAEEHPSLIVHAGRGIRDLISLVGPDYGKKRLISQPVTLHIYWGAAGTGKTLTAWRTWPQLYKKPEADSKWWDGYQGEEVVLIDEFNPFGFEKTRLEYWLAVFDRYPHKVEVKGGYRELLATRFVLTTNSNPADWWKNESEERQQAWNRRVTETREFTRDDVIDLTQ